MLGEVVRDSALTSADSWKILAEATVTKEEKCNSPPHRPINILRTFLDGQHHTCKDERECYSYCRASELGLVKQDPWTSYCTRRPPRSRLGVWHATSNLTVELLVGCEANAAALPDLQPPQPARESFLININIP